MRRSIVMFLLVATTAAVFTASPASARPIPEERDAPARGRLLAPGRVVERVEIGRLGDRRTRVVKRRTLGTRIHRIGRTGFNLAYVTGEMLRAGEGCFYAKPQWSRYNGFGRLSSKAWYYIEWCGRGGKVTRVMKSFCGGVGAQGFRFGGCKLRRGSVGGSKVVVSGSWRFPFVIGPYTLITRTMTVSARHYAAGRATGTFWMHQ